MWISPRDWPRVRVVFEHALTLPGPERFFYVAGPVATSRRAGVTAA